jgi:hypothetical protein
MCKRKTLGELVPTWHEIFGTLPDGRYRFDYSGTVYEGRNKPMAVRCVAHDHVFWQTPDSHSRGCYACQSCIQNNRMMKKGSLKIFEANPSLMEEVDYKASGLTCAQVARLSKGSGKPLAWRCKKNHTWKAPIARRVGNGLVRGSNCSKCQFRGIGIDNNNLLAKFPELSNEWSKRNKTDPSKIFPSSHKAAWWTCSKCKLEYRRAISSRTRHQSGCPRCHVWGWSQAAISWLKSIEHARGIEIQHAESGGEFRIPGTLYHVDGYHLASNTAFEYYGSFWHGDPKMFDPHDMHPIKRKTYREVYQDTLDREQIIRNLGYNLVTKWECDDDEDDIEEETTEPEKEVQLFGRYKLITCPIEGPICDQSHLEESEPADDVHDVDVPDDGAFWVCSDCHQEYQPRIGPDSRTYYACDTCM